MPEQALAKRELGGFGHAHLGANGRLKWLQLVVGEGHEEGLQKDDGFPQTGIQIVVSCVHNLPIGVGVHRADAGNLSGSGAKIVVKIVDHFAQRADLVKELGALAEKDAAEQAA